MSGPLMDYSLKGATALSKMRTALSLWNVWSATSLSKDPTTHGD